MGSCIVRPSQTTVETADDTEGSMCRPPSRAAPLASAVDSPPQHSSGRGGDKSVITPSNHLPIIDSTQVDPLTPQDHHRFSHSDGTAAWSGHRTHTSTSTPQTVVQHPTPASEPISSQPHIGCGNTLLLTPAGCSVAGQPAVVSHISPLDGGASSHDSVSNPFAPLNSNDTANSKDGVRKHAAGSSAALVNDPPNPSLGVEGASAEVPKLCSAAAVPREDRNNLVEQVALMSSGPPTNKQRTSSLPDGGSRVTLVLPLEPSPSRAMLRPDPLSTGSARRVMVPNSERDGSFGSGRKLFNREPDSSRGSAFVSPSGMPLGGGLLAGIEHKLPMFTFACDEAHPPQQQQPLQGSLRRATSDSALGGTSPMDAGYGASSNTSVMAPQIYSTTTGTAMTFAGSARQPGQMSSASHVSMLSAFSNVTSNGVRAIDTLLMEGMISRASGPEHPSTISALRSHGSATAYTGSSTSASNRIAAHQQQRSRQQLLVSLPVATVIPIEGGAPTGSPSQLSAVDMMDTIQSSRQPMLGLGAPSYPWMHNHFGGVFGGGDDGGGGYMAPAVEGSGGLDATDIYYCYTGEASVVSARQYDEPHMHREDVVEPLCLEAPVAASEGVLSSYELH